jgi:hypothetical protein
MPNIVNYATKFERQLRQKYSLGLKTTALTSPAGGTGIRFVDANTIKIPYVVTAGYKDHSRAGGFNRQEVENRWLTKTLAFDRDIEFLVDVMDVDETNQVLSAANITNTFLTEQAIPETDCYRISKMYAEFVALGGTPDNTAITAANALALFDSYMQTMDEAEVPEEGRILYITPPVDTALKNASAISRSINVNNNNGKIERAVHQLEDVTITKIPSARMKSAYNFSNGFAPATSAVQINMILVHPRSVIAVDKHAYIKLWPEGTHTVGDGYLYQNRKYGDLFLIDTRINGVAINAAAPAQA